MELDEIKKLSIPGYAVVELDFHEPVFIEIDGHVEEIYGAWGWYLRCVEELPETWGEGSRREDHAKTPFIEVAHFKRRNLCPAVIREYPIENIRYLRVHGKGFT